MNRTLPLLTLSLLLAACTSSGPGNNTSSSSSAVSITSSSSVGVTSSSIAQADAELSSHQPGATITSPVTLTGRARGPWYFEASFPVEIRNAQNVVIAQGPAQAQGNWMTTSWVPFTITLTFPAQTVGSTGSIVLKKDNPSGEPQNDASVTVPVVF